MKNSILLEVCVRTHGCVCVCVSGCMCVHTIFQRLAQEGLSKGGVDMLRVGESNRAHHLCLYNWEPRMFFSIFNLLE